MHSWRTHMCAQAGCMHALQQQLHCNTAQESSTQVQPTSQAACQISTEHVLSLNYCAIQVPLQGNPVHAGQYCTLCDRAAQGLLVRHSCSHPMV
jgi:hypothetical protein